MQRSYFDCTVSRSGCCESDSRRADCAIYGRGVEPTGFGNSDDLEHYQYGYLDFERALGGDDQFFGTSDCCWIGRDADYGCFGWRKCYLECYGCDRWLWFDAGDKLYAYNLDNSDRAGEYVYGGDDAVYRHGRSDRTQYGKHYQSSSVGLEQYAGRDDYSRGTGDVDWWWNDDYYGTVGWNDRDSDIDGFGEFNYPDHTESDDHSRRRECYGCGSTGTVDCHWQS